MSTKTKTPSLWLFVREERRDGYFHLRARITTDSRERHPESREGRFPYGCDDRYAGPLYSDLQASCQGDSGSRQSETRECAVYGFNELVYGERYATDLREAERMVQTLKALNRGLAKLAEVRGYARTYPEYIGRLAEVLKCKGMVFERSRQSAEMTGEKYEWLSIGDGITRAANLIYQWQREGKPEAVSA
jgi:hypothetical protein